MSIPPLASESRPRLAPGVRLHEDKVRGAWVLLAPETLIEANPSAVQIVRRCTGAATVREIVADLAMTFAADPTVIGRDVNTLLGQLIEKKLIDP